MHASPFDFNSQVSRYGTPRSAREMQYFEAYTYYFDNPNWFINLLLVTVCQFIPFVGMIVLLGYEYELIIAKHKGTGETYPDFDFGRFTDYLTRGIWPFLVFLILGLVLVPLGLVAWLGMFLLVGVAGGSGNAAPVIVLLVFAGAFLFFIALQIALMLVTTPMALQAGLTKDLSQAFDMGFVKDFVRRVGWEIVLVHLFIMVSSWLLLMLGMLACFVGMYPAIALVQVANTHLIWQLYELYLDRGGMPILLTDDDVIEAERA